MTTCGLLDAPTPRCSISHELTTLTTFARGARLSLFICEHSLVSHHIALAVESGTHHLSFPPRCWVGSYYYHCGSRSYNTRTSVVASVGSLGVR